MPCGERKLRFTMLDVRRLRHLSELARRGTIAEVARAIGYTPSAVSQSLLQLEREAGVALLERDGRRVRLTPAAHGLVARTERVLAELDAAEAELAAEQQTVRGRVVAGAFPSAATQLVIPATLELARRHPELAVSVREHEPEDGIALLRSGELDLLVSESYENVDPAPVGGLDAQLLLSEPLLLALPESEPADEPAALASYREAAWIGGLAGTQYAVAVEQACRTAGFTPRIAHRADEASLIQALTASGLGVGFVPALACSGAEGVRYVEVRPAPPARLIHALVRRGAARRPALGALLGALRAAGERQTRQRAVSSSDPGGADGSGSPAGARRPSRARAR
jgi:DNA-binding transcriptional LysR family regulator